MNASAGPQSLTIPIPIHEATYLTKGGQEARIILHGKVYCLRITRQGKLILTK